MYGTYIPALAIWLDYPITLFDGTFGLVEGLRKLAIMGAIDPKMPA